MFSHIKNQTVNISEHIFQEKQHTQTHVHCNNTANIQGKKFRVAVSSFQGYWYI